MTLHIHIHPENPQERLIRQGAQMLREGGVLVVPTDTNYAFVCQLGDKAAADKMRALRGLGEKDHPFSLLCADLSQLAVYARVDNQQFRLLKLGTPGPYTYILGATKDVPNRLSHPRRKTIGLRVPDQVITQALLQEMGEPLLATTVIPAGEERALNDGQEIADRFDRSIQAVFDAGACPNQPSTVIDLSGTEPILVRAGLGDPVALGFQVNQ